MAVEACISHSMPTCKVVKHMSYILINFDWPPRFEPSPSGIVTSDITQMEMLPDDSNEKNILLLNVIEELLMVYWGR